MGFEFVSNILTNMKRLILCIFFARALAIGAQPLVFHLPDRVERRAAKWIRSIPSEERPNIYFRLGDAHNSSHDYELLCCSDGNNGGEWGRCVSQSNRYVEINTQVFPLSFDFDELYALNSIQTFATPGIVGARDGLIKRQITIFHGFKINFDKKDFKRRRKIVESSLTKPFRYKTRSPIVYFINDQVEKEVADSFKSQEIENSYIVLSNNRRFSILELFIFEEDTDSLTRSLVQRTNRFLLIGKAKIPILFNYDYILDSTRKSSHIQDSQAEIIKKAPIMKFLLRKHLQKASPE